MHSKIDPLLHEPIVSTAAAQFAMHQALQTLLEFSA